MKGKIIAITLVTLAVVMGAGMWWFQTRAWYDPAPARDQVDVAGVAVAITDFQGLVSEMSPLKLRSCFRVSGAPDAPTAPEPTPLIGPDWFECFDAAQIQRDLDAGAATAYLAAADEPKGFDRIVAVYPDGRAFEWRQVNETYAN